MSHFEAPIWSMQGAETFSVNFGHTLPNSTNHLGPLDNIRFLRFGFTSLISATLLRHPFRHFHPHFQFCDKNIIHMSPDGKHFWRRHSCSHTILQNYIRPTPVASSYAGGAAKQNGPLDAHLPPYIVPSVAPPLRAAGSPPLELLPLLLGKAAPPPSEPTQHLPPLLGGEQYAHPIVQTHNSFHVSTLPLQ